ncbi:MAG: hypothetical protein ACRENJ_03235 [Candidatus Eiseniibacteriota bacterium]
MSASWLSEPLHRQRPTPVILAILALVLGLAGAASEVRAQRRAVPDSGSRVARVRVSDRGIVVDGVSIRDTTRAGGGDWMSRHDRRERLRERIRARVRSGDMIDIHDGGTGIVRIWSDAHVPAGEVVDGEVVAVFGSVTVEGTVTQEVVAVMGSVYLKPGARVDGDVVSIGGTIEQGEGVQIKGESVQLGIAPFTWGLPARSVILFAIATGWLVSMFTGWIFALLFPAGMLRVATVVERRPAASFFLGLISLPGFFVALILLCITVIGIPLAVLLPMIYMLIGYAGQLAATAVLGARITRRSLAEGLMLPLLVGTLFVAGLLGIGAVMLFGGGASKPVALFLLVSGGLLVLGLGALGTGAFLLSRFGTRPRDVLWRGHAPQPVASGPLPGSVSPPATG